MIFFPESNFEVSKEIKVLNIIAYYWGVMSVIIFKSIN